MQAEIIRQRFNHQTFSFVIESDKERVNSLIWWGSPGSIKISNKIPTIVRNMFLRLPWSREMLQQSVGAFIRHTACQARGVSPEGAGFESWGGGGSGPNMTPAQRYHVQRFAHSGDVDKAHGRRLSGPVSSDVNIKRQLYTHHFKYWCSHTRKGTFLNVREPLNPCINTVYDVFFTVPTGKTPAPPNSTCIFHCVSYSDGLSDPKTRWQWGAPQGEQSRPISLKMCLC